jgi:hypothetical protein
MPLFVASLASVILAGSGLVAVTVFANGGDGSGNSGSSGDGSGNGDGDGSGDGGSDSGDGGYGNDDSGSDTCVIGTWRLVTYTEESEFGSARMIEGEPVFSFAEDGTGRADFPAGTTMAMETVVVDAEAQVEGPITYQYRTSGQTLEFVEQDSQADFSSELDILSVPGELTVETGPLDYACDGDAMTITGDEQAFEYQRSDA